MTLYLFAELLLLNLAAFTIGLGLAWLIWGRRGRN
jgi:hypothetical protein